MVFLIQWKLGYLVFIEKCFLQKSWKILRRPWKTRIKLEKLSGKQKIKQQNKKWKLLLASPSPLGNNPRAASIFCFVALSSASHLAFLALFASSKAFLGSSTTFGGNTFL